MQFFPNKPSSDWFAGTLDEVATYQYPLSAAQVKAHSAAAFQTPTAPAPSTPTGLRVTGTTSTTVSLTWNAVSGATTTSSLGAVRIFRL